MKKSTIVLIVLAFVMISVIPLFGIISLIAVPNLAGVQYRSMINTDIRVAETITKAVVIWNADIIEGGEERELPKTPVEYCDIEGLCPEYIKDSYVARSYKNGAGKYYITSVEDGDSLVICCYIGDRAPIQPDEVPAVYYDGAGPDWAYVYYLE